MDNERLRDWQGMVVGCLKAVCHHDRSRLERCMTNGVFDDEKVYKLACLNGPFGRVPYLEGATLDELIVSLFMFTNDESYKKDARCWRYKSSEKTHRRASMPSLQTLVAYFEEDQCPSTPTTVRFQGVDTDEHEDEEGEMEIVNYNDSDEPADQPDITVSDTAATPPHNGSGGGNGVGGGGGSLPPTPPTPLPSLEVLEDVLVVEGDENRPPQYRHACESEDCKVQTEFPPRLIHQTYDTLQRPPPHADGYQSDGGDYCSDTAIDNPALNTNNDDRARMITGSPEEQGVRLPCSDCLQGMYDRLRGRGRSLSPDVPSEDEQYSPPASQTLDARHSLYDCALQRQNSRHHQERDRSTDDEDRRSPTYCYKVTVPNSDEEVAALVSMLPQVPTRRPGGGIGSDENLWPSSRTREAWVPSGRVQCNRIPLGVLETLVDDAECDGDDLYR